MRINTKKIIAIVSIIGFIGASAAFIKSDRHYIYVDKSLSLSDLKSAVKKTEKEKDSIIAGLEKKYVEARDSVYTLMLVIDEDDKKLQGISANYEAKLKTYKKNKELNNIDITQNDCDGLIKEQENYTLAALERIAYSDTIINVQQNALLNRDSTIGILQEKSKVLSDAFNYATQQHADLLMQYNKALAKNKGHKIKLKGVILVASGLLAKIILTK